MKERIFLGNKVALIVDMYPVYKMNYQLHTIKRKKLYFIHKRERRGLCSRGVMSGGLCPDTILQTCT